MLAFELESAALRKHPESCLARWVDTSISMEGASLAFRRLLGVFVCFAASLICCTHASAHPLGNFTINHLTILKVSPSRLHIRYVLDIAEIPTFQIMSQASGRWSEARMEQWAHDERGLVVAGLHVNADGRALTLESNRDSARTRPGAGGLPLLYWVGEFTAVIPRETRSIDVTDVVYGDRRIGWKDIVVLPAREPTHELQRYPSALIGTPRRIDHVTFELSRGSAVHIVSLEDAAPDVNGSVSLVRSNALSDMFSNANRTPLFIVLTVLVAFGLGALHAIEPGHGKALLAFTLVGSRATARQAVVLAASLTFAHTIGVFVLGFVLFFAAGFASESIYGWITLLSGVAVAVIGARNLGRYVHARFGHITTVHEHHHQVPAHDHHHGGGKEGHVHVIPGSGPIDFRAAVVAAMSGGVAPCPAAIVVMLASLRLHQLGYGMLLIVIFSMGLAAVLTALGLAVVHGSAFISRSRRFDRLVAAGPLLSALLISVVGSIMVGQGFVAQGVHASIWVIAVLCLLAIAGYSVVPAHAHGHVQIRGEA